MRQRDFPGVERAKRRGRRRERGRGRRRSRAIPRRTSWRRDRASRTPRPGHVPRDCSLRRRERRRVWNVAEKLERRRRARRRASRRAPWGDADVFRFLGEPFRQIERIQQRTRRERGLPGVRARLRVCGRRRRDVVARPDRRRQRRRVALRRKSARARGRGRRGRSVRLSPRRRRRWRPHRGVG
ncbi:uncharacterized protein MICPUCDRAFT_64521 [Micromonas pusilla CCMP1545]|uniref:Predicted protein n=1 Tax=Micromonas pusilla (strain CCMP1545) TaxID=564608 RepID=C1MKN9_MICPC|nr:uncharacterized protein MICPUCDRAFT_64521 [Micromonas pusilla CCMP1545]EEH59403.1 predicted protein [Micromonas pusilla CCMP1545]|eukprot:XP_003056027.1 predicted protein [Micromonas pusilla CCMP1545]